LPDWGEVFAEL
jgi:transposase